MTILAFQPRWPTLGWAVQEAKIYMAAMITAALLALAYALPVFGIVASLTALYFWMRRVRAERAEPRFEFVLPEEGLESHLKGAYPAALAFSPATKLHAMHHGQNGFSEDQTPFDGPDQTG